MDSIFNDDQFEYNMMYEGLQRSEMVPPDKHLDSPITISLLERIVDCLSKLETKRENFRPSYTSFTYSKFITLLKKEPYLGSSGFKYLMEPLLNYLVGKLGSLHIIYPNDYPQLFEREYEGSINLSQDLNLAYSLFKIEEASYKDWISPLTSSNFSSLPEINISRNTIMHYRRYKYWDQIVEVYRYGKSKNMYGDRSKIILKGSTFVMFNGFVVEERPNVKAGLRPTLHLYSYEQLMMLQDACLARFNTYLALSLSFHNGTGKLEHHITKLLEWQELCIRYYGNDGYELVKGPESVFKTYLTHLSEGDILEYGSFNRTLDKLSQKEEKLLKKKLTTLFYRQSEEDNVNQIKDLTTSPLVSRLRKICIEVDNIDNAVELFGLTKLSGHPYVDASVSAQSVKDEAVGNGAICPMAIIHYPQFLKRLIIVSYITKHGCWPPFKTPPALGTKLYKMWKMNFLSVNLHELDISELEDVRFGKWMDFDYSPEYLDFIDDKAISPGIKEAGKFWLGGNSTSPRRLLEKLIGTEEIDTRAIVSRMAKGKFFEDELIVELTQKEREFKIAARCFAKMVFEVRMFFVLTEANLKNFMGGSSGNNGYLPQQTMTMTESATKQRLYELTKDTKAKKSICLEVDFSRWNLRWRRCTVNPCGRILEDIFAFPGVFTQTHKFFEKCTILLTDKHTIPNTIQRTLPVSKWDEGNLVWRKHQGGFEGISQSLWTICTIAMMYWALEGLDVSFLMAGQGDNQIFTLTFPSHLHLKEQLIALLVQIDMRCTRLNHEVKPEECIDSSTVLTYSKEIYVSGVHKQYVLKYASRSFARQDLSVPSLMKELAGVNATSMACASNSKRIQPVFLWKFIQSILVIRHRIDSKIYLKEKPLLHKLLTTHSISFLLPSSVGGLPMIPWTKFLIRGESDTLGWDIAALLKIGKYEPKIRNFLIALNSGLFTEKELNPSVLISDPHSVPVHKLSDDSNILTRDVECALPSKNRNLDLKPLLTLSTKYEGEAYKKWLLKTSPLAPEIISDLYQITPSGLREKILKRFSLTRTISKITNNVSHVAQIQRNTLNILISLFDKLDSCRRISGVIPTTSYEFSCNLRSMWKLDLKNANIGAYNPFDFELSKLKPSSPMISAEITSNISTLLHDLGKAPPNFGTNTKTKVSKHGYAIANTGSSIRDLKRAIMISSEMGNTPDIHRLVDSIVSARSNWSTEKLLGIFPTAYGGTGIHRHNSLSRKPFGLMGSSTVPTHITFSTDSSGILSGGEDDYPVVFQEFFLLMTHIAQSACANDLVIPHSFGFIVPSVLEPIPSLVIEVKGSIPQVKWPNLENNRLAFVNYLSFYEIPSVPSNNLVEKTDIYNNSITVESKILSYLYYDDRLSCYTKIPDVNFPLSYDLIDVKEFSRVDPEVFSDMFILFSLIKAFERINSMPNSSDSDVFAIEKSFSIVLKKYMMFFSACMVRQLLHPKFKQSSYATENLILLNPGESCHIVSSKRLYLTWVNKVMTSNHRKILLSKLSTVLLPVEWKTKIHHFLPSYALTLFYLATSYKHKLSESLKMLSNISKKLSYCSDNIDLQFIKIKEGLPAFLKNYFDIIITPIKFFYVPMSAKECLRSLRTLKLNQTYTHKEEKSLMYPPVSIHCKGIVKFKKEGKSGTLAPDLTETCPVSKLELFSSHFRRRIGISASVTSDWLVYSKLNPSFFDSNAIIGLFGVGRGATSAICTSLQCPCVGFDLRSSHPLLPHRSSSYIPPELKNNQSFFRWSNHYLHTDGNIFNFNWDLKSEDISRLIIDMDLPLHSLLPILPHIPLNMRVLLRCRLTYNQLRFLVDALDINTVHTMFEIKSDLSSSYIIDFNSKQSSAKGNFENVTITHKPCLDYTIEKLNDQLLQLSENFYSYFISKGRSLDTDPNSLIEILKQLDLDTESEFTSFLSKPLSSISNSQTKILGKFFSIKYSEKPFLLKQILKLGSSILS